MIGRTISGGSAAQRSLTIYNNTAGIRDIHRGVRRGMLNAFVQKLRGLVDLDAATIVRVETATTNPRLFRAKQDLIREGDMTGPVFVMLRGWACRYKILPNGSRQVTAFMMPGDACDLHMSLVTAMDHSIQTISAAEIAIISRRDMDVLIDEHPDFARAMDIAQLIDEATLRAWIVSMGRRSSLERISHLMCELYLRASEIGLTDGKRLTLPLTQLILADALGMTPVHINRVLKELRQLGAMDLQRGFLVIDDPDTLVRISGFDENYLHRRSASGLLGVRASN